MSHKFSLLILISLLVAASAFAQYEIDVSIPGFRTVSYYALAVPGGSDYSIPGNIALNQYYIASVESNKLAVEFFDMGEYEVSTLKAMEAIHMADLSDEYIAEQMILENEDVLNFVYHNNLDTVYPNEYKAGRESYEASLIAFTNREWTESIYSTITSIDILAALQIPPGQVPWQEPVIVTSPAATPNVTQTPASVVTTPTTVPLPSQYTVRSWESSKDCLWNIAGYSWVYGDPTKWTVLYDANKSRMPQPNNPDLIHPGFVLNIPSIKGEVRQGMWSPTANYGL